MKVVDFNLAHTVVRASAMQDGIIRKSDNVAFAIVGEAAADGIVAHFEEHKAVRHVLVEMSNTHLKRPR